MNTLELEKMMANVYALSTGNLIIKNDKLIPTSDVVKLLNIPRYPNIIANGIEEMLEDFTHAEYLSVAEMRLYVQKLRSGK
jgi:hypothetical protein